jgi:hypothetical protein
MVTRALLVLLALALIAGPAAAAPPPLPNPAGNGSSGNASGGKGPSGRIPRIGSGTATATATSAAGLLDLAAAVIVPADLPEPGFGVANASLQTIDQFAAYLGGYTGGAAADQSKAKANLTSAGWTESYYINLAKPSGDDATKNSADVYIGLARFGGAKGGAAGYELLHAALAAGGYQKAQGGAAAGDQSSVTRHSYTASDGRKVAELDMIFQSGEMVVEIDLFDYSNQPPAVSDLQTIATAQAKRVKNVPASPGLSLRALSLTASAITTNYAYYSRLGGKQIPYRGETADTLTSDDGYYAGQKIDDIFQLEQWTPGADGKDGDYVEYFLTLYQFESVKDATAAVESWPQGFVENPGTGITDGQVLASPPQLGDDSAMVSLTYKRANGVSAPGYIFYVATGAMMMVVTVESPAKPTKAGATTLAKAALACVTNSACAPLPVPAGLGA